MVLTRLDPALAVKWECTPQLTPLHPRLSPLLLQVILGYNG